jgi:hypothetical protein
LSDPVARDRPLWLVFGPSGTGKSSFGDYLAKERDWLHLEVDQFHSPRETAPDGMDVHDLRRPWDAFYEACDPAPLAAELARRTAAQGKAGCVLTFPSGVLLSTRHFERAPAPMRMIIFFGTSGECLAGFLEREAAIGRNLGFSFWRTFNMLGYLAMGLPEFAPWRIDVFRAGKRRPHAELLEEIAARAPTAPP